MELNLDNEIDKKLSDLYSKDVLENVKPGVIDYLGMNIFEKSDCDIEFKIYYDDGQSREEYEQKYKDPMIDFLYEKDMVRFLEIVHDKDNNECTRFNIGLQNLSNENVLSLFNWLEDNIKFFHKYKDEIMKLSTLQCSLNDDFKYASFYFIGVVKEEKEIKVLKCYWFTRTREPHEILNTENHLNFIDKCNPGDGAFKNLISLTKDAIKNCEGRILMAGIDYNEKRSEKHKLYIADPENIYAGLLKTFSDNEKLKKEIELIKEWHNIHQEFNAEGFAVGSDINGNLVLNIYFKFKEDC